MVVYERIVDLVYYLLWEVDVVVDDLDEDYFVGLVYVDLDIGFGEVDGVLYEVVYVVDDFGVVVDCGLVWIVV